MHSNFFLGDKRATDAQVGKALRAADIGWGANGASNPPGLASAACIINIGQGANGVASVQPGKSARPATGANGVVSAQPGGVASRRFQDANSVHRPTW